MTESEKTYPPIGDYAVISDCHGAALISRTGSVDWCCMPRIDADSTFGRLLDWQRGGYWSIAPVCNFKSARSYASETFVLVTDFIADEGTARLYDFFAVSDEPSEQNHNLHVRIVEGVSGAVNMQFVLAARFDYGATVPCTHQHSPNMSVAWGSNQGIIVYSDIELQAVKPGDLRADFTVGEGQRIRFSSRSVAPAELDDDAFRPHETAEFLDRQLENTLNWWRRWTRQIHPQYRQHPQTLRSALALKALTYEPTGAIAAAVTTSLPEWPGSNRNWDYRYSWIRDSVFTVRALHDLGASREADRFAAFIERSAAGSAEQLQIVFGVDGERRLTEIELDWLHGYQGSRPVRIGNVAAKQLQMDTYGELLELAWIRHCKGSKITHRRWQLLAEVVNLAAERWHEPDCGIWEVRTGPKHFVFSKALCWCALQRGIQLASIYGFDAPVDQWIQARDQVREAVFQQGYDAERGIFRQTFDTDYVDAALLLLPWFGFIDYNDPRMVRTTDAICAQLKRGGLLLRYNSPDGFASEEGAFLPCTFWLVDCLAHQGRLDEAQTYYDRACTCASDEGLFSEEFDTQNEQMLGNIPQGLTHVSQIVAHLSLNSCGRT